MGDYEPYDGPLDASSMRLAIVAGRFNAHITRRLLDGALGALRKQGLPDDALTLRWVPGAFEIPLVAERLARSGAVDAVICLGAVIKGETAHFEYVAGPCAAGIARVAVDTGVPVAFGILTTYDEDQALERSGGATGDKGAEAALSAIEMVELLRGLPPC